MCGVILWLLQYAFMVWCLVKHRDNFAITFTLKFCKESEDGFRMWKIIEVKHHIIMMDISVRILLQMLYVNLLIYSVFHCSCTNKWIQCSVWCRWALTYQFKRNFHLQSSWTMETNLHDRNNGSEAACIKHMSLSWLQVRNWGSNTL